MRALGNIDQRHKELYNGNCEISRIFPTRYKVELKRSPYNLTYSFFTSASHTTRRLHIIYIEAQLTSSCWTEKYLASNCKTEEYSVNKDSRDTSKLFYPYIHKCSREPKVCIRRLEVQIWKGGDYNKTQKQESKQSHLFLHKLNKKQKRPSLLSVCLYSSFGKPPCHA